MKKYDFNNPEHFKVLERQAYDGVIDISDFPPAAYRYFDCLRILYEEYKFKGLSMEEAQQRKQKLLHKYSEATAVIAGMTAAYHHYQDNIRKAGTLLSEIEKADDVRIMLDYATEAIGCMTGDENFHKRIKKKVEEIYT